MPLTALTLSFECDQTSRDSMTVIGDDSAPVIYQANVTTIRASLFNGTPATETFVADISNVTSARLLIRKNYSGGTVLIDKTATLDGTTTYANWVVGTKQHFSFALSAVETNQTLPSDGTLDIYGVIEIVTSTGPVVIGFFNGTIKYDGVTGVSSPVLPNNGSTQVLGAPVATVTFSGITQAYTHLKVFISCGSTHTDDDYDLLHMTFNGGSPTNKHWTAILDGGDQNSQTPSGGTDENHNFIVLGRVTTDVVDLKRGGGYVVDIPFYRQTQYSVFCFSQGYAYMELDGPDVYHRTGEFGRGQQTAISSITFSLEFGGNFPTGSAFSLLAY